MLSTCLRCKPVCGPSCWPSMAAAWSQLTCCMALQSIGIPPITIDLEMLETKRMLLQLFSMGVKPEALLLPQRPDQGKCKLCTLSSLQALIDIFLLDTKYRPAQWTKDDLAQYKEVIGLLYLLLIWPGPATGCVQVWWSLRPCASCIGAERVRYCC